MQSKKIRKKIPPTFTDMTQLFVKGRHFLFSIILHSQEQIGNQSLSLLTKYLFV